MAKKVNKKEMLRQAKALRTVRGRVTKYIKNKTDLAFNDLADSVEANVETITIDFKTFKKNIGKILVETHKRATEESINAVDEMYGLSKKVPNFNDIVDKRLNDFNKKKAAETVTKIDEVTKNKINKIITERQAEGLNAKAIAKEVKDNVKGMTKDRSLTIARTETSKASGYSMHELAKETLVNTKVWIHVGGGKHHRENHLAMDGEEKPIDKPFSNDLMYAHESGAKAKEVINCYCITTYKFKV
jgi:phage protein F-like protein